MQKLKERNPLLVKMLAVLLLVLMCCNLPSLFFWSLCLKQDLFRPSNTEVLVSACKRPFATGVPGGEVVFVREKLADKIYLLDLRSGEKRDIPNDPLLLDHGVFLSSELVWLEGSNFSQPKSPEYMPHYILDLTDGRRYEMLNLNLLPRLEGGKFDTKYYSYFQSAEQVFIHHSKYTLIALSPDFRQHPERNVVFSKTPSGNFKHGEVLKQLMNDLEVRYEIADFSLQYADVPSPTGKYVVRNDGIYLSKTNIPVVTGYMEYYFRGWYYDESGVVIQEGTKYLFSSTLYDFSYPIPTPILKLRLPAQ